MPAVFQFAPANVLWYFLPASLLVCFVLGASAYEIPRRIARHAALRFAQIVGGFGAAFLLVSMLTAGL